MVTNHTSGLESFLVKPRIVPPLDPDFRPASLANRAFQKAVTDSGKGQAVTAASLPYIGK